MSNRITISVQAYEALRAHLLRSATERVAFIFASFLLSANGVLFMALDYYLVTPEEVECQSEYYVSLTDEAQARVIKRAWDTETALIELHSHVDHQGLVRFSPSDIAGFAEFVPHVWWRLRGRPYAALVLGHHGFDALVWRLNPHTPEQLNALQVGRRVLRPSGLTLAVLRREERGRG